MSRMFRWYGERREMRVEDGGAEPIRSDEELAADVRLAIRVAQNMIAADPVRYRRIAVSTRDGVVILTGTAAADAAQAAAGIAQGSTGVHDVRNLIDAAAEPVSAAERRAFDEIVAGLRPERPRSASRARLLGPAALATAVAWSLLLVALVEFGRPALVVLAVAGVVGLLVLPLVRRRSRRT